VAWNGSWPLGCSGGCGLPAACGEARLGVQHVIGAIGGLSQLNRRKPTIGREPFAAGGCPAKMAIPRTIDSPVASGGEQPAGALRSDQQGKPAGGPRSCGGARRATRRQWRPSAAEIAQSWAALRLETRHGRSQYICGSPGRLRNFRKRPSRDSGDLRLQESSCSPSAISAGGRTFSIAPGRQLNPPERRSPGLHAAIRCFTSKLVKVFKSWGWPRCGWRREVFDPIAMNRGGAARSPVSGYPEGDFIVEELQRGYQLDGRVLRHAL